MTFIDDDGVFQQLSYVQGVGTGRGTSKLARLVDKFGGGAFGWGLTRTIEEAYRSLAFSYEPGDEIYIFGFSRGAFTARSLAGLIRSSGIPPRTRIDRIPLAIARYRSGKKKTKPNDIESFQFRHDINADIVTSPEEAAWRQQNNLARGEMLNIAYLGVWDTVVALGIPAHYGALARMFNGKYNFHDADLSRSVKSARHAISIDERRRTYPPAPWANLPILNGAVAGDQQPYHQAWFPGNHGSVGGGGDITGLSSDTLVWIAEGAQAAGLQFETDLLDWHKDQRDHMASLINTKTPKTGLLKRLTEMVKKDRNPPLGGNEISPAARQRWKDDPTYRPKTLADVAADYGLI